MDKKTVLVVDDEWNMRNLLRIYLGKQGLEVREAANGQEALALAEKMSFDVVLLDVMMPDMDGWQVCRRIREKSSAPILMLTARSETKDKVQGLSLGADDYVTKPFDPEELVARVFALIRRSSGALAVGPAAGEPRIEAQGLAILPEGRQVLVHGNAVDFTVKEFDLLLTLARHPQKAFTREVLVDSLWGVDYFGDSRVVDTHVKNIREKLSKAGLPYNPIQTVWGVGYKLQASGGGDTP